MNRLARFRADPTKVRVAVRPEGRRWTATIEPRDKSMPPVVCHGLSPKQALWAALRRSAELHIPGVDLDMQWAYDHPFPLTG